MQFVSNILISYYSITVENYFYKIKYYFLNIYDVHSKSVLKPRSWLNGVVLYLSTKNKSEKVSTVDSHKSGPKKIRIPDNSNR